MLNLRNIALISSLTFCSTIYAATEFPNNLIPGEIAEEFSFGKIYNSLPDNFPIPALPAGTDLYVLGSADNGASQRVLLGTSLTGAELRDVLKTAYAADGWLDLSRSARTLELCHDVQGRLIFEMAEPVANSNRVFVHKNSGIPMTENPLTCAQQLSYQNGGPAPSAYLVFMESVPELEMPPEATGSVPTLPWGSFSSSSGPTGVYLERSQDNSLSIPDYSLVELHEHFVQQLIAQGWELDTDSVGTKSTAATWFKTVQVPPTSPTAATQIEITGVMTLLNPKENIYRVMMTVHTGQVYLSTPFGIRPFRVN